MDRKIFILGGAVLIIIMFFSTITFSVGSRNNNAIYNTNNNNTNIRKIPQTTQKYMAGDVLARDLSIYGLPQKDEYMSQTLKEQIDNLETKFYYDNCRYQLA
jgi:hypothetical protein